MKHLESFLRTHKNESLPKIRYFDGLDIEGANNEPAKPFATLNGRYRGESLEESYRLFLLEKLGKLI